MSAGLDYWQRYLTGLPAVHNLPTDRARPVHGVQSSGMLRGLLDADQYARLHAYSGREKTTAGAVLQAAFVAMLARHSGESDIVIGSAVPARACDVIDNSGVLPLRVEVSEASSFRTLQQACAAGMRDAATHAMPLAAIASSVNAGVDTSHPPLFQAMFGEHVMLKAPAAAALLADMDIALIATWSATDCWLEWRYAEALFERATIERWAGHFAVLLDELLQQPDAPVWKLPFMTDEERCRVLVDWNWTAAPCLADCRVDELIARQASATPDLLAVRCASSRLTYRDLEHRAAEFARQLHRHGVQPGDVVGVCLPRSSELIAVLLAIWKAGAAYVPLDPAYPSERLRFMVQDSCARCVVATTDSAKVLEGTDGVSVTGPAIILLDAAGLLGPLTPQLLSTEPLHSAGPEALAYLIYTSGSTGLPKGVAIEHRNAMALLGWARATYTDGDLAGVLAATSVCFDLSIFEMFAPLCCGGSVIVVENALDIAGIRMAGDAITLINTVPSAMKVLVEEEQVPSSVRVVNLAGEPLSGALVRAIYATTRVERVYNLYGPTEDTTYSTGALIPRDDPAEPTIGRSISNRAVYVLDRHGAPVPIGVVGEVFVAGPGVARGYLNRPELTAERFLLDPFSSAPDARMYRTGDLARWSVEGQLHYLGRIDHQVKIRGFRIELGEVQSRISALPDVADALVVANANGHGELRLIAYVVARPDDSTHGQSLVDNWRDALLAQLPEFMVPLAFIVLDAFPLTPNGKIDRGRLPAPAIEVMTFTPPSTAREIELAALWQELLQTTGAIGAEADFFALGGQSLLATRLIARLRRRGIDLPLKTVFQHPVLSDLARVLDDAPASPAAMPVSMSRPERIPLSLTQSRMWFMQQLEGAATLHNEQWIHRLVGPLDEAALRLALDRIADRHESLRTLFAVSPDGSPFQQIVERVAFEWRTVDLVRIDAELRAGSLDRVLEEEGARPFMWDREPMLRPCLVRLQPAEHVLLVTQHHAATDGWSFDVLAKEWSEIYAAILEERAPHLPALALQYADYALWQHQAHDQQALDVGIAYWTQQLAGIPQVHGLPLDRPRPARQRYYGRIHRQVLDGALTGRLRARCREEGATLFMGLHAAFAALLARHSGEEDIVVGAPVAGRDHEAIENLIGCFVNTLLLRADLSGAPSFRSLLRQCRGVALDAYTHQSVPIDVLVDRLTKTRDLSHAPLFQVALALPNHARSVLAFPNVVAEAVPPPVREAKFELSLEVFEEGERLDLLWTYRTDLFEAATIERLAEHFAVFLDGALAMPDDDVWQLPLLDAAERRRVLVDWNATEAAFPTGCSVAALVEAQVVRTPDAAAIVHNGLTITYRELDRRAARLAGALCEQGVDRSSVVAILAERSAWAIVGMLAAWKAGAAYLPIDPAYPQARIEHMLQDSGSTVLLLTEALDERMQATAIPRIALDGEDARRVDSPLSSPGRGDDAAYVIYTSGSTGLPKGVVNTHAALANLCYWHIATYGADDSARASHLASPGFDAAVWEIWPYLVSGGCLVIVDDEVRADALRLPALLREQCITHCFVPTGLLELLGEAEALADTDLRYVLTGGDRLNRYCLRRGGAARLFNHYGPTEAAVVATAGEVFPVETEQGPSIGRPIANVRTYVLDRHRQPQPIGVVGELCIAGAGLAQGYLGAAETTAARFVHDPFVGENSALMYRTGDLARWLPDGRLEFVGRVDRQVKLRGFRIELGEIESRLAALPGVEAAVVVVREDQPGLQRLVAYIVANDPEATPDALRERLRAVLPDYMLPSAIMSLDRLPSTANGKLDRDALPAPDASAVGGRSPSTHGEHLLAALWCDLLQIDDCDIDANFFELGGQSLLITRMIHAIAERTGLRLAVRDVLECPTIATLAPRLARVQLDSGPRRGERQDGALPLSMSQFRVWYVGQLRGETSEHNIPISLIARGDVDESALRKALAALVSRHEILRARIVLGESGPRQVFEPHVEVPLTVHDLRDATPDQLRLQVDALLGAHARRPFDLAEAPLLAAMLLRTGEREYRFQLNFHHLLVDGWSVRQLVDELLHDHASQIAGQELAVRVDAPFEYADFVAWQARSQAEGGAARQTAFWSDYLRGSGTVSLPGLKQWRECPVRDDSFIEMSLDAELREHLLVLARRHRTSLFGVLYSAFALLIARLSGQPDFNIGIPVSGRHTPGSERLIGNFLNNLPVRNRIDLLEPFTTYLDRQTRNIAGVLSHQDVPFEQILNCLPQARDGDSTPLFQLFFNMLNLPEAGPVPDGLDIEFDRTPEIDPKFALTAYVQDSEDGIELLCHFDRRLFTDAATAHLISQYAALLAQVADNPTRRCGEFSLRLDGPEPSEPQRYWPGPVHTIIEDRAVRSPDAIAIVEADRHWTYAELLHASRAIAIQLQRVGVGHGDVVAVVARRGAELVVAVLGILQAGAAFSLLNPDNPPERLALLAGVLAPRACVYAGAPMRFAEEIIDRLRPIAPALFLDAAALDPRIDVSGFVAADAAPRQLACLTFTSGTTGVPKAVAGVHIGLSGYLGWVPDWLGISAIDRFSMLSGLAHDPIQRDMFSALCAGAAIMIPGEDDIAPHQLAAWMRHNKVTFAHMTPGMARILCATDEDSLPHLRVAFLTGERLDHDVVHALQKFNPEMRILNSYGTTETQRAVTYFEASAHPEYRPTIPSSETAPDAVLRVLNACGTSCGIGEVGDVYLESHHLSDGYRNEPSLTAQVMTVDGNGLRRYRTGDIACRLPDGIVMCLGRKDSQVKIRGFRVETAEIEAQLRTVEGVAEAAVHLMSRTDGDDPVLIGYVVPSSDAPDETALVTAVRAHATRMLPGYMHPAAIVVLAQLPLTANGKLDHTALPVPDWNRDGGAEPDSETERWLVEIWSDVLRVEHVGVDDNFFEIGGHSMLMVVLATRVKRLGPSGLNLSRLMRCGTIREQAQLIEKAGLRESAHP